MSHLLFLWIIFLSFLYSLLSIIRHNHFQSGGFDLGIYDQAVWQYSQFLYPYNTIKERMILGDHLTLTLPLLAPLFYIWNDVRMLLIFQAVWISFSSLAVYKLVRLKKFSQGISLLLSIIYSLFYGIQAAIFFDFHPVMIGVGLLAWLIYFFEAKRSKLIILTLALFLLTQENMGIALTCIGIFYVFKKEQRCSATLFIIGGIIWSLIAAKIIAFFSPIGFQYTPHIVLEPLSLAKSFFDAPEKQQVWLYSLGWFSFLPLFSPGSMLAVFLDLSQYFTTGPDFARMWSPLTHHRAILAPFLLLGTLDVLIFLRSKKINIEIASIVLFIIMLTVQYMFHFPLNKLAKLEYWKNESWMEDNYKLLSLIMPKQSIATQQNLIPHVSHRKEIYIVYPKIRDFEKESPCGQKSCWWLDFAGKPEYLLVDLHPNQWITQLLETNEHFEEAVNNMEKAGKITLEKNVGFARLYRIIY